MGSSGLRETLLSRQQQVPVPAFCNRYDKRKTATHD